jgi:hypothetical protein
LGESPISFSLHSYGEGTKRALKAKRIDIIVTGLCPDEGMNAQTHQQFVDDTMLMGMASILEDKAIKHMLKAFKRESGLEVNKDKSLIFYFNTHLSLDETSLESWSSLKGPFPRNTWAPLSWKVRPHKGTRRSC